MPGQKAAEQSLIDFLNSDPNQVDFGFVRNLVKEIILNPERTISNQERQMLSQALERNPNILSDQELSIISDQMMKSAKPMSLQEMQAIPESRKYGDMMKGYAGGGEASFPDLSGDGKTTYKDVLIGRGVKLAEGGEVDQMLAEVQESPVEDEAAAMGMLEGSRQDFEILEQIIQVVMNLMQQGFTEGEIIALLKEQGLDDEDAKTAVEYAKEVMGQAQQAGQAEQDIGAQLAALG
jgi:hypothetical protein